MTNAPPICFLDTETTGLNAFAHQVYEVALITPELAEVEPDTNLTVDEAEAQDPEPVFELNWKEHHWWLNVDLAQADPAALRIGGYHDRHPSGHASHNRLTSDKVKEVTDPEAFSSKFARLTHGLHLAGMVPSFDELFLRGILLGNGQCPTWHYQPIDVETLAVGWLLGQENNDSYWTPPYDSEDVSLAVGVDPAKFERHTAMGDARWAKAVYEAVTGE